MAEYMEYEWRAQSGVREGCEEWGGRKGGCAPGERAARVSALRRAGGETAATESDVSLRRYLWARKWDVQAALALLEAYRGYRRRHAHVFASLSAAAADVRASLEDGLPGVLEQRDRRGRRVLLMQAARWDAARYPLLAVYRALLLSLDHLTADEQNQANGLVLIVDWTEFPARQAAHLSPRVLRLAVDGLQDCYPARFKAVHHVNQGWAVGAALSLLRLALNEKARERMHAHGNNLATLHQHVPVDILPTELGGERPSYDPRPWLRQLSYLPHSTTR